MWLPRIELTQSDIIDEFDQWVTPSLGNIRDSNKFQNELGLLQSIVKDIGDVVRTCHGDYDVAMDLVIKNYLEIENSTRASSNLESLINLVFLATAKSDNAVKCQYPIHYRKHFGETFPQVNRRGINFTKAPDVLKADKLVETVIKLRSSDISSAQKLITDYVKFVLGQPSDQRQFRALVETYLYSESQEDFNGTDFLSPLVAFQVRGSVAASGGHEPEQIVRAYLRTWGLTDQVHFNLYDITASNLNNWLADSGETDRSRLSDGDSKTRAFDFILPYQSLNAKRRVLIQSQFYAGDSGSVSHKNVDQASKARSQASEIFPDARFVELVDGAGYCGSLRKDLKHLLFAADTDDFVQVRSIPVRLRRILQESGIILPLDIAVLVREGASHADLLLSDLECRVRGCAQGILNDAIELGWLKDESGKLTVSSEKDEIVSRYVTFDRIIAENRAIQVGHENGTFILVPGFGPNRGVAYDSTWPINDVEALLRDGNVMVVEL